MREPDATTPVVTGTGLVTALGFGVEAAWRALGEGQTGIAPLDDADPNAGFGLAALVEPPYLRTEVPRALEAQIKFLNGAGELAVEAAVEARAGAGWEAADVAPWAQGLWLAQLDSWDWGLQEMRAAFAEATEEFTKPYTDEDLGRYNARRTKPFFLLESIKNNAFSFLANWFDLEGSNTSVAGFAGATLPLLDLACRALGRGDVDRALVVATGRPAHGVARRDYVLHALSRAAARAAYRPLTADGTGLAPGEGAAALVVERLESVRARGAEPTALLLGHGSTSGEPLEDVPAPCAGTVRLAAARALETAGIEEGDLLGVVVPSLALPEADRAVLDALADLPATRTTPVVSWRGAMGHLALAADLADVVLTMKGLATGTLPATVGLGEPLAVEAPPIPTDAVTGEACAVLVLGAGIHGEASAVVVARTDS